MNYRSQISDMQEGKMKKTIVAFRRLNTWLLFADRRPVQ